MNSKPPFNYDKMLSNDLIIFIPVPCFLQGKKFHITSINYLMTINLLKQKTDVECLVEK